MVDDIEQKAAGLTHFIFKVPTYKRLMLFIILVSFLAGFILKAVFGLNGTVGITEAFLFGGADGVVVFGLPAVVGALLATSILSLSSFRQALKYFLFISSFSLVIAIGMILLGFLLIRTIPWIGGITEFILLAAALSMAVWLVGLRVPLNYSFPKALAVSLIHPLLQISLFLIWRAYAVIDMKSPLLFAIQFVVACGILMLALWSILLLVNAPTKRNFGISAVQASALMFAQWIKGGKGLEEILAEVGTLVETEVSVVGFVRPGGKTQDVKASFVVPLVHFGPVGNLGGSEYPFLISDDMSKKVGGETFVFHGTVTHDFNPVFSSSHSNISDKAAHLVLSKTGYSPKAGIWLAKPCDECSAHVFLLGVGGSKRSAFTAISRAPHNTDDIDLPLGFSIRNLILTQGFKRAAVVDMHNSKTDDPDVTTCSRAYYELEDAIRALKPEGFGNLYLGIGKDPLSDFTLAQGIGKAGMKIAVLQVGKTRSCIVLIDSNNMLPTFRSHIMESLSSYKFDFIDIFTTDSHAVNTVNGAHNPLGQNVSSHQLLPRIRKAIDMALRDLEPVLAKSESARIRIHVLGEHRVPELVSTINAIVAILRILAPLILIVSVLLAFLALFFLGRTIV